MKSKMQKRVRRNRRETKYFQGLGYKGRIPSGDKNVHIPSVDFTSYEEKLQEGLLRGRVEVGLFYASREYGGRSTRIPHKIVEVLQQQADILHELNNRRSSKEGR